MRVLLNGFAVVGLFLTAACGPTVPDFQSPPQGVTLKLTPNLGPAFLASRQATVFIAEERTECGYETLGAVRPADLPKTVLVEAGKIYNLRVVYEVTSTRVHSQLVSDHLFEPQPGSNYELVMTQNKVGHSLVLKRNGLNQPFARPCLTNTN